MAFGHWTSVVAVVTVVGCGSSSSEPPKPAAGGKVGTGGSAGASHAAGASGKGAAGADNRAGAGGSGGTAVAGRGGTGGSGEQAGRGGAQQGGGAGTGGSAGTGVSAGSGGDSSEPGGAGGEAGASSSCTLVTTTKKHALHARSAGFSGTESQYDEIYNLDCQVTPDCQSACADRGGTTDMCNDTICELSSPNYCLPTPIWLGLNALDAEGTEPSVDGAEIVLWSYPYHDPLLADQFKLEVPNGADVTGITATIRRAAGGDDEAVDSSVHLIKHGVVGTADRALAAPWSAPDFVDADYGGPSDLWGDTWTAADLNADDFGVALTVAYPQSAGSGRGYVDIVYVTVTYRTCP